MCFLLCLFLVFACSNEQNIPQDAIIQVGSHYVTAENLKGRIADYGRRLGLPDNGQTRQAILTQVVNEQLLLEEATRLGLDSDAAAQLQRSKIEKQRLLDLAFDNYVGNTLQINESELLECFQRINTQVTARHLPARTLEEAQRLKAALSQGRSFEDLAYECFSDPRLMLNGGKLEPFSFDEMDPAFEDAAFTLDIDEISTPVKLKQGYSIIQVLDRVSKPLLTENQFNQKRDQLSRIIRHRKLATASKATVDALVADLHVEFDQKGLDAVTATSSATPGSDDLEQGRLDQINLDPTIVVAKSSLGELTVADLNTLLQHDSATHTNWIQNENSLRKFITGLLARESLLQKAREDQLDQDPRYLELVQSDFDTYLLERQEARILSDHVALDSTLLNYFRQHRDRFQTEETVELAGILLPDEPTATGVASMLKRGADFGVLAQHYSLHKKSRLHQGNLGLYPRSLLKTDLEPVNTLSPDQWVGPLALDSGYGIFKVLSIQSTAPKAFTEVRGDVEAQYLLANKSKLLQDHLDHIRTQIPVNIREGALYQL